MSIQNWLQIRFKDREHLVFLKERWEERPDDCPVGLWGLLYPQDSTSDDLETWRFDNWGVSDDLLHADISWNIDEKQMELEFKTDEPPYGVYNYVRRWWEADVFSYYYDADYNDVGGVFIWEMDGKILYENDDMYCEEIHAVSTKHWVFERLNMIMNY